VILEANTATNPGTVVVHLHHTAVTQTAVMSSWGLNEVALVAISEHDEAFELIVVVYLALLILVRVV
jgi:hypothetical protein